MHEIWHVIEHALLDTLKIAPILLLVYFLIEFLEYKKLMKFENSKMLKGKASPVFGALFGSLPQCGFSVVTTDLYTKRFVSIGALLAVYIATSDEALPIMLSNMDGIVPLLVLVASKIVLGVIVGYLSIWLYPKIFKKNNIEFINTVTSTNENININKAVAEDVDSEHHHEDHEHHNHSEEYVEHDVHHHDHEEQEMHEHIGCCHHDLDSTKFDWLHPLLHCLRIVLYILIVNLLFTAVIEVVGKDKLTEFLSQSSFIQPILAVIIGLIPNCASSVVITELYLLGGLSFGSILAGLSVNAGLGLMVLFKQEKNVKEILFVLAMLIIPSLIAGYVVHFIMM